MQPDARKLRLRIPLGIELSWAVIRSPECFSADCFQMQVLENIPKVLLLENSHLIIHLWSRILLFHDVFLVPFSSSVKPNCSHLFEPAPQILSWLTERTIRNKSSVFGASALKCMVSLLLFFSEFHDSNHWYSWKLDDLSLCIAPPFEWL